MEAAPGRKGFRKCADRSRFILLPIVDSNMQKEQCGNGGGSQNPRYTSTRKEEGVHGPVRSNRVAGHAPTFLSSPDTMSGGVYGGGM